MCRCMIYLKLKCPPPPKQQHSKQRRVQGGGQWRGCGEDGRSEEGGSQENGNEVSHSSTPSESGRLIKLGWLR